MAFLSGLHKDSGNVVRSEEGRWGNKCWSRKENTVDRLLSRDAKSDTFGGAGNSVNLCSFVPVISLAEVIVIDDGCLSKWSM